MKTKFKHGDTLIEVLLAMSVFAVVLVSSVQIMNSGLNEAQRSLEITMARTEIDAQAEAIRYIHNSYASEREYDEKNRQYSKLWETITSTSGTSPVAFSYGTDFTGTKYVMSNVDSCEEAYEAQVAETGGHAFVLNTRFLIPRPSDMSNTDYQNKIVNNILVRGGADTIIKSASLYPRLIFKEFADDSKAEGEATVSKTTTSNSSLMEGRLYRQLSAAEGIWVYAVEGEKATVGLQNEPQYYDFYIRTCWNAAGQSTFTTLGTVVRQYNPGVVD